MRDKESTPTSTSYEWGYDPSYEWPGSTSDFLDDNDVNVSTNAPATTASHARPCLRLVVKHSSVLPDKRRVAVLDAYDEVQIGRDVSNSEVIPRIRLKDMEVSKLHATLYWDHKTESWAIVDMGSKHGTFVRQTASQKAGGSSSSLSDPGGVRLSPSRHTSFPRGLNHLDELSVGNTVFVIHIHSQGIPCNDCHSDGDCDIPLFSTSKFAPPKAVSVANIPTTKAPEDPKKALSLLKRTLLSRHASDESSTDSSQERRRYIDRSARRRSLHPYSRSDSPGTLPDRSSPSAVSSRSVSTTDASSTSSTATGSGHSAIAAPISESNIGHRLLARQGWAPGEALGSESTHLDTDTSRTALTEPLAVQANIGRTGLGMRISAVSTPTSTAGEDWKESSKRRRWEEIRSQSR